MTMEEVRQYPNKGLLSIACGRLEKAATGKPGEGGSQDGADGKPLMLNVNEDAK